MKPLCNITVTVWDVLILIADASCHKIIRSSRIVIAIENAKNWIVDRQAHRLNNENLNGENILYPLKKLLVVRNQPVMSQIINLTFSMYSEYKVI